MLPLYFAPGSELFAVIYALHEIGVPDTLA